MCVQIFSHSSTGDMIKFSINYPSDPTASVAHCKPSLIGCLAKCGQLRKGRRPESHCYSLGNHTTQIKLAPSTTDLLLLMTDVIAIIKPLTNKYLSKMDLQESHMPRVTRGGRILLRVVLNCLLFVPTRFHTERRVSLLVSLHISQNALSLHFLNSSVILSWSIYEYICTFHIIMTVVLGT